MKKLIYTLEQIYNDTNIEEKPYPFCPKCRKKIFIEANISSLETIRYEIKCKCRHFIYVSNTDINKLIEEWNKSCISEIADSYASFVHDNIFKYIVSIVFLCIITMYILELPYLILPIGLLLAYSPVLFSYFMDSSLATKLIKEKIVNKVINNKDYFLNKNLENNIINIKEDVNDWLTVDTIMSELNYNYYEKNQIINQIIQILKEIRIYYDKYSNQLDQEYIHMLKKFYDTIKLTEEDNEIYNTFLKFFNNKLEIIKHNEKKYINKELLNIKKELIYK